MPHCAGLGRLIACDLIGMGDSDKLEPSGPERYAYAEHRDYLDALWEALDLGDRVVLVVHDWGSVLGFDWARRHRERVQGIAYMEAVKIGRHTSELQSLMRISYAVFCLHKTTNQQPHTSHLLL